VCVLCGTRYAIAPLFIISYFHRPTIVLKLLCILSRWGIVCDCVYHSIIIISEAHPQRVNTPYHAQFYYIMHTHLSYTVILCVCMCMCVCVCDTHNIISHFLTGDATTVPMMNYNIPNSSGFIIPDGSLPMPQTIGTTMHDPSYLSPLALSSVSNTKTIRIAY
jgi:hypothetical protein